VRRLKELESENARPKKLLAESMLDQEALRAALGKVLTPVARREAVAVMRERRAYRSAGLAGWLAWREACFATRRERGRTMRC